MNNVKAATNQLIVVIKESSAYKEYEQQLFRVKQQPDLKRQIDEFRTRNYIMQLSEDNGLDKLEQLEREYGSFKEKPPVADFLAAELAFCRMIQEINIHITEEMHFE